MTPADPDPEPSSAAPPAPAPDPVPEPLPPEEVDTPGLDAPQTGISVVDDVLAGLRGVDDRPVDERVQAFERAQEGLRGALDDDPGDPAGA